MISTVVGVFSRDDESQAYTDDPDHFQLYDLNTVANYDPAVVPLLDSPSMSAFERDQAGTSFSATRFPASGLD